MTPEAQLFAQNLLTFLGIAVLSVPVWALNGRKKRLERIKRIVRRRGRTGDAGALDRISQELERKRAADAAEWRRLDEICLYAGYGMLFAGSGWRLF
jgi:hypothetical protein